MIIKYEIEQFCKDIEAKLDTLSGKAYDNAKDKIAILNRVHIEFMDYEDLMRKLALQNNDIKCDFMKMKLQLREQQSKIDYLEEELKTLKQNING